MYLLEKDEELRRLCKKQIIREEPITQNCNLRK